MCVGVSKSQICGYFVCVCVAGWVGGCLGGWLAGCRWVGGCARLLQHAATYLQHIYSASSSQFSNLPQLRTTQHSATPCNTLAKPCNTNTLQNNAAHCSTLQHTATHCNTLQHTCNTPTLPPVVISAICHNSRLPPWSKKIKISSQKIQKSAHCSIYYTK